MIWHDGRPACPISEAAGEWPVPVAVPCGRCDRDLAGADEVPDLGNQLAEPGRSMVSHLSGMSLFA